MNDVLQSIELALNFSLIRTEFIWHDVGSSGGLF